MVFQLISVFLNALIVDKHPTDVRKEGGGKIPPLGTTGGKIRGGGKRLTDGNQGGIPPLSPPNIRGGIKTML